jgi:hypothetical protein
MLNCEATGKYIFTSKKQARRALVGHLGGKTMRVYQCPDDKTHYHVTKTWKSKYEPRSIND